MRLRLKASLALLACSLLAPGVAEAQEIDGPNSGPAAGERTREGALAYAQYNNFRDRSGGGGGGGGSRSYDCAWYAWEGSPDSDPSSDTGNDSLKYQDLVDEYEAFGFSEDAGDVLKVRIRCTDEAGNEPEWSPYTQDWSPAVEEIEVDPADLAQDAWNMLDYPVPVGETAPPLESGTYAQLETFAAVDDWEPLTATATAGPVTSTVTADPIQQEWVIHDALRGDQTFTCEDQGGPDSTCGWTPENSSAGQPSRDPESGEPCFDVTILVQWGVTWTFDSPSGSGGPESLGSDWMASSTCIVVAEIQAVVDDG